VKALADELNIDAVNEALAEVHGLGFDLGGLGAKKASAPRRHLGEDSEAVSSQMENVLQDVRDAIDAARNQWDVIGKDMKADDQRAWAAIDKVMDALHAVDRAVAKVL